jgi:hypothetical protein
MVPVDDPDRFNPAVDRFFRTPFVKKNRVGDLLRSLQRLGREKAAEEAAAK